MMQGGVDALHEAGVVLLGGHSIKDKEIKFGFAVTGMVHPARIITNDKARPGDALILTKPIGTGVISFAAQIGKSRPEWVETIGRSMAELNRSAAEVMIEAGVLCATDVTGFGLMGHVSEMAVQSGVSIEIRAADVPLFVGVRELVGQGIISGAIERNREFSNKFVERSPGVPEDLETILYDPQTSGGLLMCVQAGRADAVLTQLRGRGIASAAIIGRVTEKSSGRIVLI
jgi:selenide,water dikinase